MVMALTWSSGTLADAAQLTHSDGKRTMTSLANAKVRTRHPIPVIRVIDASGDAQLITAGPAAEGHPRRKSPASGEDSSLRSQRTCGHRDEVDGPRGSPPN